MFIFFQKESPIVHKHIISQICQRWKTSWMQLSTADDNRMKNIHYPGCNGREALIYESNKESLCFLVGQVETEPLFDTSQYAFTVCGRIVREIFNPCVTHQMKKIQNEASTFSQSVKSLAGKRAELSVFAAFNASHTVDHLQCQKKMTVRYVWFTMTETILDGSHLACQPKCWRKWFRIAPKNETCRRYSVVSARLLSMDQFNFLRGFRRTKINVY